MKATRTSDAILAPHRRRCERCGRVETWSEGTRTWTIDRGGGKRQPGSRYCIHEWDITGSFCPVRSVDRHDGRTAADRESMSGATRRLPPADDGPHSPQASTR